MQNNIWIATLLVLLSSCKAPKPDALVIGIVEPLEHCSIQAIATGFSDAIQQASSKPVVIKIENSQNDANLQRAIIQKMVDGRVDYIVPIGASATQMAVAMAHGKPIISLASNVSQSDRNKLHPCELAVVHDEISPLRLIEFFHAVYPQLKNLTLIHSAADKVFPDVKTVVEASKSYGITVKAIMVASLPELYAATQALPTQSEGIFILKDNLIVSGIPTLAKVAKHRHIPLITSDEGSVQSGAAFALGVHEREIGVQGARLLLAALNGKKLCSLPIVEMKNLTVFLNPTALQQQSQSSDAITTAAHQYHYTIENVSQTP